MRPAEDVVEEKQTGVKPSFFFFFFFSEGPKEASFTLFTP